MNMFVDMIEEQFVTIPIELSNDEFIALAKMAHEKDITLNRLVNDMLREVIAKWNT